MDHHPRRAEGDGPDYTLAWLTARAAGVDEGGMEAYMEAAEQLHDENADGDRSENAAKTGKSAGFSAILCPTSRRRGR